MNIPADEQIMSLAKEVLAFAGHDYTPEQLTEIPKILATKNKYWWCVDMQLLDMMPYIWATIPSCSSPVKKQPAYSPVSMTTTPIRMTIPLMRDGHFM